MRFYRHPATAIALALTLTLTACGGGRDSNADDLTLTFKVGRTSIEWTDATRAEMCGNVPSGTRRRLQAYVWYPAAPAAGAQPAPLLSAAQVQLLAEAQAAEPAVLSKLPSKSYEGAPLDARRGTYPVLLMSHGAGGGSPLMYASTAEAMAAKGYVVVGLSHTYHSLATFFADGSVKPIDTACDPLGAQPELTETSTFADYTANWNYSVALDEYLTADLGSALTRLKAMNNDDPLFRARLQVDRVGAFGHSYGGSHAFRALRTLKGVVAAANIDGSVYSQDFASGVDKPYLSLASSDSTPSPAARASSQSQLQALGLSAEQAVIVLDRGLSLRQAYEHSSSAYYVTIPSARHLNFSDVALWDALGVPADRSEVNVPDAKAILELQNTVLADFFNKHLRGLSTSVQLPGTVLTGVTLESRP